MTKFTEQMETAAILALSGERERARELFRQVVEIVPSQVDAWLWLSELTDNLEEQVDALENAMKYVEQSPEGQQSLQDRLVAIRSSAALPGPDDPKPASLFPKEKEDHDETFQRAERLSILGRNEEAIALLNLLLKKDPARVDAMLLMSELEPDLVDKVRWLEAVVTCDPENDRAAMRLSDLRPLRENPLRAGQYLEQNGEMDQAVELYRKVAARAASMEEKVEANRRIACIEQRLRGEEARSMFLQAVRRPVEQIVRWFSPH